MLDSLDKETLVRLSFSQAEAIERLTREVGALRAGNAKLHAENVALPADSAALRAKLLGGAILQSDETGLRVGKRN